LSRPVRCQRTTEEGDLFDNTIVTSKAACKHHGGVQKPGGLNKAGKEVNNAAIDAKEGTEKAPRKSVTA
jgi:hypothetical protein